MRVRCCGATIQRVDVSTWLYLIDRKTQTITYDFIRTTSAIYYMCVYSRVFSLVSHTFAVAAYRVRDNVQHHYWSECCVS